MEVLAVNDTNFAQKVADNKIVVVKYYADWCGSCKLFAPKFNRIAKEEQYSNIVFLDVDAENSPAARKAAEVDNLPFLAVFKDGKLLEGAATSKEEYLRKMIEKAQN